MLSTVNTARIHETCNKGIALFKNYLTLFFHRASGGGHLATAVSVQDQRMDWPVVPCPVQKDNNY